MKNKLVVRVCSGYQFGIVYNDAIIKVYLQSERSFFRKGGKDYVE